MSGELDAIGQCVVCGESVASSGCVCWCDFCDQFYADCLEQESWCLDVMLDAA